MVCISRFKKSQNAKTSNLTDDPFDLDRALLRVTAHDVWRIRDACEGTVIFGGTGSGKTSGSGETIAKAFLAAGFGGLVLTAKNDECALWQRYARETGRADDLILFSPEEPRRFNFMNYELTRPGRGAGITQNLVNALSTALEIAERRNRSSSDGYWQRTTQQLLRNAIDLLAIATGSVSLPDLYRIITSAPASIAQSHEFAWQAHSFCFECIRQGDNVAESPIQAHDFELAAEYWLREFPGIAEKTRSIIISSFTSMADCFLRGILRELFCTELSIVPEVCLDGGIIILNLPVKEFGQQGQFAQVVFKHLWQQAMERRNVLENPRPVFLWADESQLFFVSNDREFQSTARSARVCTVYLTQNLPSYYAALGGESMARSETDAFLGNLQTKIFHCNSDRMTNEWAADLCARSYQYRHNFGAAGTERRSSQSAGVSESLDYEILPREFSRLRTGGPDNASIVDAIVYQSGRTWKASRKSFVRAQFLQKGF